MIRFRSVLLLLALLGCAAPATPPPPLIRLSLAPVSAFIPDPAGAPAGTQVFRQRVDPIEMLGVDSVDFPAIRLGQDEARTPGSGIPQHALVANARHREGIWSTIPA